jgi:hypothetical protein
MLKIFTLHARNVNLKKIFWPFFVVIFQYLEVFVQIIKNSRAFPEKSKHKKYFAGF